MHAKLSGLHLTYKRLATNEVCIYAYGGRGGPSIGKAKGATRALARERLQAVLGQPDALAKLSVIRSVEGAATSDRKSRKYVFGLVSAFLASPEFEKLGRTTKHSYRTYLDRFREEFGDYKVSLFERFQIVEDLVEWRDEYADRPRVADYSIQAVSRLFSWARQKGLTGADPTRDIRGIYESDRSNIIWLDTDIAKIKSVASDEMGWAVDLAALTGLRTGDLLTLTWAKVSEAAVVWQTSKRGRFAVVPILPETSALLKAIPKRGPMVLTNTRGKPWTPDGFKTSFGKARSKAGITELHFHDLRGTAATRFAMSDLTNRDIAQIMAWSEKHVEALMLKYVSGDRLALDMLQRMKQKPPPTNQRQTKATG